MIKTMSGNTPVLLSGGVLAFSLFGDSLLYSVLPLHAETLGIPVVFVGIALSINRWVRIFSNPLSVKVFRRFGFNLPMLFSCAAAVLTALAYAYPAGVFLLLAARAVWGVCWSHLRLGSYLVVFRTAREKLGLGMGSLRAVSRLGSAFALLAGGALVDGLGYSRGLAATALLSGFSIPMFFLLRKSLRNGSIHTAAYSTLTAGGMPGRRVQREASCAPGEKSQVYLRYAAGFMNSFVVQGLVISSLSYILQERMSGELSMEGAVAGMATLSGMILATRWLSAFIVSPLLGHLSDSRSRRPLLILCTGAQSVCLFAVGLTGLPVWTVAGALVIFIAGSASETLLHAAIGDTVNRESPAGRLSEFATFSDTGAASGPLAGYLVAGRFGFSAMYVSAGVLVLVLFFLLYGRFVCMRERPGEGGA